MSSGSYRLESFRPWNPFQDKTQPHRDSLDIHRYPSPVSITATSPPSNSSDPASRSPKVHSHKPERHPLPARPPVEVCLNDSLPQETNTMHLSSAEDQACINSGTEVFAFEDILQLQDLPSSGDGEYSMSGGDLGLESQYPLSCESGDRELAFTSGQHSQVGNAGSPVLTGECYDSTIDPAILDDRHFRDVEQTPATKASYSVVKPSCPSDKIAHTHGMRQDSQRAMKSGRQRSKVNKVSVVVDNHTMNILSLIDMIVEI